MISVFVRIVTVLQGRWRVRVLDATPDDGASKSQPGGILGNRDKLKALADIKIMSPAEVVLFVEKKIAERDAWNVRVAQETGKALPAWTGKD